MFLRNPRPVVFHRDGDGVTPDTTRGGGQPQRRPARRVADGVRGEVLQRLLEPIAIAPHVLRAGLDRRAQRDARGLARALMTCRHAVEELCDRDALDRQRPAAPLEPREIQQVADDAFQPRRLVADDGEVARPRRLVERELRHRERLEVPAHRRHRRRQLVRHVGEQLPPHPIRGRQRFRAGREVVGHRVERARHRRDLVAAAVGCSRGEIAGAEVACRRLQSPQAPARGAKNHDRREKRAHDEHAAGHHAERRREASEQEAKRRARRHDHDARRLAADHDRDWPVEPEAGPGAPIRPLGIKPIDAGALDVLGPAAQPRVSET